MSTNHMQMKQSNIKTMSFIKVPQEFRLPQYSQAFLGDVNGDQIDDLIFDNLDSKSGGKLNVAIFNKVT